jgi:hypothetical protein
MTAKPKHSKRPYRSATAARREAVFGDDGGPIPRKLLAQLVTALTAASNIPIKVSLADPPLTAPDADSVDNLLTLQELQRLLDELDLLNIQRKIGEPVHDAKRNEITRSLGSFVVYNNEVETDKRVSKPLEIAWKGRGSGMTAFKYFEARFADIPFEERPTADEVRQASARFYSTLAQYQSQRGQSIHDLFPRDPDARGGAKAKNGGPLTFERLMERVERTRERNRLNKAKERASKKAQPDGPR